MSESKTTHIHFRPPQKLKEEIQKDAEKLGISVNEWLIKASEHFLTCKQDDTQPAMKLILLKYPTKCRKCGNLIPAFTYAYYGKGVGAICLDCIIKRIGDKTLVAKYLKKRELERLIKALQNEADRLATKIEDYQISEKLDSLFKQTSEQHKLLMKYLNEALGTPKEKQALEELVETCRKTFQIIRDIEAYIESRLKIKIKQKRR